MKKIFTIVFLTAIVFYYAKAGDTTSDTSASLKTETVETSKDSEQSSLDEMDLQDQLMRDAQTVQTLSNISKVLHDAALAVIRKIG